MERQPNLASFNWNNHSARENREVVVSLRSDGAADYFARVFRADWRGGAWRIPVGVLVVGAAGVVGVVALARRFEFDPAAAAGPTDDERVGW